MDGEKQRERLNQPPVTFSPGSTSFPNLLPLPSCPKQHRRMGNGGQWLVHNSSSLLLLPPHTCPCSSVGRPHGPQFLSEEPVPAWALHGLQFFQAVSTCSNLVLSTGCREIPAFTIVSSMGCKKYLLYCGLFQTFHGLQGNLFSRQISALAPGSPPSLCFFLTLVFTGLFLIPFVPSSSACVTFFCPFLNMFSQRWYPCG